MAVADISAKELAAKLDTSPRAVTRWRRGEGNPDGYQAGDLEQLSGGAVPASCWRERKSTRAA